MKNNQGKFPLGKINTERLSNFGVKENLRVLARKIRNVY